MRLLFSIKSGTKKEIAKEFRRLSFPMVSEMFFQNLFNLVDTFFVSKIGYAAIAAVTSSAILLMLFMTLAFGISAASGSLIAIKKGRGEGEQIPYILYDALVLSVPVSLVVLLFAGTLSLSLPSALGLKGDSFNLAEQYLLITFYGIPLFFVLPIINSALRSIGKPAQALKVVVVANIINIILDPILIFGLGIISPLGVRGAAISTIISRMCGVILQLYFLKKSFVFNISLKKYTASAMHFILPIIKNAIPAAMHLTWRILSMLVIVRIVSIFGSKPLAAFGIVIRSFQVILFPTFGLGNAAFVMVGYSVGAKRFDLLKKSVSIALTYAILFVIAVSVIYFVFSSQIIGIFSSDSEVIADGSLFMKFQAISYPAVGATVIFSRVFMGTGDTLTPSIVNLVNLFFFMIPLAYLLSVSLGYGTIGVWTALPLSNITGCIIFSILYKLNLKKWRLL